MSHAVDKFRNSGVFLEGLQTFLQSLNSVWKNSPLFLNLLRLTQSFVNVVSVQLVEQHHLKGVLRLLDQKETDDFWYAVVQNLNHNSKVSVEPFPDFADKKFFPVVGFSRSFLQLKYQVPLSNRLLPKDTRCRSWKPSTFPLRSKCPKCSLSGFLDQKACCWWSPWRCLEGLGTWRRPSNSVGQPIPKVIGKFSLKRYKWGL